MNAAGTNGTGLLSGDDNFLLNHAPIKSGLAIVPSASLIAWDTNRHGYLVKRSWFTKTKTGIGNTLLNDGSVQSATQHSLVNQFNQTGLATNRIVIP